MACQRSPPSSVRSVKTPRLPSLLGQSSSSSTTDGSIDARGKLGRKPGSRAPPQFLCSSIPRSCPASASASQRSLLFHREGIPADYRTAAVHHVASYIPLCASTSDSDLDTDLTVLPASYRGPFCFTCFVLPHRRPTPHCNCRQPWQADVTQRRRFITEAGLTAAMLMTVWRGVAPSPAPKLLRVEEA